MLGTERRRVLHRELAKLIVDDAFMITVSPSIWLLGSWQQVEGRTLNIERLSVYERIALR